MIRRPPRSTLDRSSAASDVYKRQMTPLRRLLAEYHDTCEKILDEEEIEVGLWAYKKPVSYTHLRAHETVLDLVCRLLLEKKKHTLN